MREIKFRGLGIKGGLKGKWLIGYYVKGSFRHCIVPDLGGIQYDIDPETLGEYTGLKDKNGNEIYEGDVIDYGDMYGKKEVAFINGAFGVLTKQKDGSSFGSYKIDDGYIIGNIYEHHKLLKE